jgi:hypothetical protein
MRQYSFGSEFAESMYTFCFYLIVCLLRCKDDHPWRAHCFVLGFVLCVLLCLSSFYVLFPLLLMSLDFLFVIAPSILSFVYIIVTLYERKLFYLCLL